MNPIFYAGPNPELKGHASPTAERAISSIRDNQQKQQNIEQSGFLNQVLGSIGEMGEEASLEKVLQKIYGSNLSPENKQNLGKQLGEHYSKKEIEKVKQQKEDKKVAEKVHLLRQGLGTVKEIRNLLDSAGPSNYFHTPSGKTAENRSKLATYGKSLINFVSNGLVVRNQKEFDEFKETITNPNSTQAKLKGAIDALEDMAKRGLEEYGFPDSGQGEGGQVPGSPEGFRSQNEKPEGDVVLTRHKDTGKRYRIPRKDYKPHPDLIEEMNQ